MIKLSRFFLPYIVFLAIIGFKGKLIIAFIIVFCHELAHYFAARKLGYSGLDIKILPIGTVLKLKDLDEVSPKEDLIISAAGPLLNFILAAVFYIINTQYYNEYFYLIYSTNLALGIFNIIPAYPLDGGRILRDLLSKKFIYKKANEITITISITLGSILMVLYFITYFRNASNLKSVPNINLGLIALFIIITSMKEKERIVYLIMGDIIKKKYKFIKRGFIENKSVSIYCRKDLLTAMGLVDKNKYNIFNVLNEDMNLVDIIYEEEIIEGLREYGNITLDELIKRNNDLNEELILKFKQNNNNSQK